MTLVPINPRAPMGIAGASGDAAATARMASQIARLEQRLRAVEVSSGTLATNSVDGGQIAPQSVNGTHITPASIDTPQIHAGAIDASVINANSVAAAVGSFISLNANQIVAGSIDAARMTTNFLQAAQAAVGTLSAITSNMGSITAGTITGATVQTAASGSRVVINSSGVTGYALGGVTPIFNLDTGTGQLSATGVITLNPGSFVPGPALYGAQLGGGNLTPNSSFEQGSQPGDATDRRLEGWENSNALGTGAGASTAFAYHGSNSYKAVAAASSNVWVGKRDAGNRIPVVPNKPYTASTWIYLPAGQPARDVRIFFYWFPDNTTAYPTNLISSASGVNAQGTPSAAAVVTLVPGQWTRVTYTQTAPAGAFYAGYIGHVYSALAGEAFYYDAFQLEPGDTPTAYAPKPDEILYSSIRSTFIGAGEIKANNLDVGSVQAQHITVSFGGQNILPNAGFSYLPTAAPQPGFTFAGSPGYWQPYENAPAEAAGRVYSTVAQGGPTGSPSWRVQVKTADGVMNSPKGFMTTSPLPQEANEWYVMSFYWKGNKQPATVSNGNRGTAVWIDNPTADPNKWQRYSQRYQMNNLGGAMSSGANDGPWVFTSFSDLANWSGFASSGTALLQQDTTFPINGSGGSAKLNVSGATGSGQTGMIYRDAGQLDVSQGQQVRVTGKAKLLGADASMTGIQFQLRLRCFNATNTYLGDVTVATQAGVTVNTTYSLTGQVDATQLLTGTTKVGYSLCLVSAAGSVQYTFLADDLRLQTGPFSDFFYVYPQFTAGVANTIDCQIALPQWEHAQVPSAWSTKADEVLPGSVGNTQIAPDAITTDKILAGTILASDILLTGGLSALTANLGTMNAGTITGATIQTATGTGARAVMDPTGFTYYNSSNAAVFTATAGAVNVVGNITAKQMSFVNIGNTTGGSQNTIFFYSGNYTNVAGSLSVYSNATGAGMDQNVYSFASGGIAQYRLNLMSADGSLFYLLGQSPYGGVDTFSFVWQPTIAGTPSNVWSITENGDMTVKGNMYLFQPGGGGGSGLGSQMWMGTATYMMVRENYGWRFDGGNHTDMTYGGQGTPHVVTLSASTGTAGATYNLGYSYAGLHVDYSDEKLKFNVRDADPTSALSRVRALRPVQYAFKGEGTSVQERGFVAQEVQAVIPDAVERIINGVSGDVTLGLKPTAMIAALVAAVQELSEAVNVLQGKDPHEKLGRDTVKPLTGKTK